MRLIQAVKKAKFAVALVAALTLAFSGMTPANATHLRGAVGYIKYDPVAKTVTVNSTMVERKDACLNGSTAYTSNLSSALGSTMPSASLCTFFGFPTITSVDPTTGATASITKCVNQATTPTSWSFDVTSEPLYNIFNTVYVINVNCPSFSPLLDYVFSQTGSNRIGGIRNTTNQVIQFEGRVKLSGGVAHTTPIYNTGYMTNVPFAAAGDNTIFKTNLNALDENGRSVTYSLVTSSAAANGGYGATRIPCSNLNTTTGEFQLGRPLCLAGENYDTSFSGGTATTPVYWALKTKATTNDGTAQYVTRDVLLSFAGATGVAPTISASPTSLTVAANGTGTITLAGRDADSGQTLSFSTNTLPSWASLNVTNRTNTAGAATLTINAAGVSSDARVIQVSVTDSSAFALSATVSIPVTIGSALLPPNAPTITSVTGDGTATSMVVNYVPATTGGTPNGYTITATPVGGGTPVVVNSSTTSATLSVTNGTYYTVVVTAKVTDPSNVLIGSADSQPYVPTTPTLTVSPTTLNFTSGSNSAPALTYVSSPSSSSYSQTGLPAGLTFNTTTGQISLTGSATVSNGTYTVTITGSNGVSVTVTVVVGNKKSQTINFTNVGAIGYETQAPQKYSDFSSTRWYVLNAYSSSGLAISYSFSPTASTWISPSTSSNTVTGANFTTNASGSSNQCYLAASGGAVYVAAVETGSSTNGQCKIFMKQDGDANYSAATAGPMMVYVAKVQNSSVGSKPKYMFTSGSSIPTISVYVNDFINHPFTLCPTTGTSASATCTTPNPNYTSSSSNQYAFTSCSVSGANSTSLPSGTKVDATTGCELVGTPTAALTSTLFTINLTNKSGTQNGSSVTPKLQFYLEVKKRAQKPTSFTQPIDLQLGATTSQSLVATSDSGNTVKFTSDNASCVISGSTVSLASGATVGTCNITASLDATSAYYASAATDNIVRSFKIKAANIAPVLALNGPQSVTINALGTYTDIFPISASAAVPTIWEFDDANGTPTLEPDGLTFDTTTGKLFGMPEAQQDFQTYTIRAKVGTNGLWSNVITVRLKIAILNQTITFDGLHGQVVGTDQNLSAVATSGLLVSFATGNPAVCTIVNGKLHAVAAGICAVSASQAGNGTSYTAAPTVTQNVTIAAALLAPSISLTNTSATVYAGEVLLPLYDILNTGGDLNVDGVNTPFSVFASDGTSAAVLPNGVSFDPAWGVFTGRPTVSAAATTYVIKACNATSCSTANFTLTVRKKPQIIAITAPATLKVPNSSALTAVSNSGASVSISIDVRTAAGVCSLTGGTNGAGTLTAVGDGTCYLVATAPGDAVFESGTASASVTILQAPALAISNSTVNMFDGVDVAGHGYSLTLSGTRDSATIYKLYDSNNAEVTTADIQGLKFSSTTGLLSGIVNWDLTAPSQDLTYTIKATNQYGTSGSVTFNLKIFYLDFGTGTYTTDGGNAPVKSITQAVNSGAIATINLVGTPGSAVTYSVAAGSPTLPAGLSLNSATGAITGTPSAVDTRTVQVVATYSGVTSTPVALTVTTTGVVSYNANGVTLSNTLPSASSASQFGQSITLSSTVPTSGSATFVSWNTISDGSGLSYAPGDTLVLGTSNVVLYVIWKINGQRDVKFNSNPPAATGITNALKTQVMSSSVATALTSASGLGFGFVGYSFGGWATTSTSTTVAYADTASPTPATTTITLYAIWTAVPVSGATAATVAATNITSAAADLSGTITTDANTSIGGSDIATVYICYSTSNATNGAGGVLNATGAALPVCSANLWDSTTESIATSTVKSISQTAGALSAVTQYYFQLQVNYSNGTSVNTTPRAFTTLDNAAAVTNAPVGISNTSAVISGVVNPKGNKVTRVWFCWGTDQTQVDNCVNQTEVPSASWWTSNSNANNTVSVTLTGLQPRTRYYYKILTDVDDRAGLKTMSIPRRPKTASTSGTTTSFLTPWADTSAATNVAGRSATLNGIVYGGSGGLANGDVQSVRLCYSYSSSVDANTGAFLTTVGCSNNLWTGSSSVAADTVSTTGQTAFVANISTLNSSTTYFSQIQVVFTNGGTSYGSTPSFTTTSTITFHSNPPAFVGGTETLAYQTASGTVALATNTFSYTGLVFSGWSLTPTGAKAYDNAQAGISVSSDIDLYALWTTRTYNVSYASGGGTWSAQPAGTTATFGSTFTLAVGTGVSKAGYHFLGWLDNAGATVAAGAQTSYLMPAQDVVFTAVWAGDVYTVSFSTNGGSGSAPGNLTYTVGATGINLPSGSSLTPPTGKVFAGWATTNNATSALASPYVPSGTLTLFAVWADAGSNTVTYDSNYPAGAGVGPGDATQRGTGVAALTGTVTAPLGYSLAGWGTAANTSPSAPSYALNGNYNFASGDIRLYALWNQLTYSVGYSAGTGGTWVTAPTNPNQVYGATFAAPAANVATYAGHHITGWTDGVTTVAPLATYHMPANNVVLTAVWALDQVAVNYVIGGASWSTTPTSQYTVGDPFTLPYPADLVYLGHTFGGWRNDANQTQPAGDPVIMAVTPMTFTAIWTTNTYTITWDPNGGSTTLPSSTWTYGNANGVDLNAASSALTPPVVGATFLGWSEVSGSGVYLPGQYYVPTATIPLYANWQLPAAQTVSFHSNFSVSNDTVVTQASNVPHALAANSFSRPGYTFLYWTTNQDGTGTQYADGANYGFSAPLSLYAQWRANAVPADPTPIVTPTPTPTPEPTVKPLPPIVPLPLAQQPAAGAATLSEESKETAGLAVPNSGNNGLSVNSQGWTLKVSSTNLEGQPSPLDAQSRVILEGGQYVHAEGSGFLPNTEVHLYVLDSPILLGILMTDATGNFTGSVPVPAGLSVGTHTFQVAGYSTGRTLRWASLQAVVQAPVGKVLTAKVYFKPNSAWLTANARKTLKSLASKVAKGYTELKVGVVGFVYHYDTKAANARVSTARAKNVSALLKKYGLKGLFVAVGKGRAIETDKTARRVEVTITYKVKSAN